MIFQFKLEHEVDGKWEETPHVIKLEIPDAAMQFLKMAELDAAFQAALKCVACEDQTLDEQKCRVQSYLHVDS
jgi:hypothetical protein